MTEHPLILRYAARSHVGLVRAKNDDSGYVGKYLAVVADGMGGHAGGDVASASTVLDLVHLDHGNHSGDAGTHLADEIQTANSLLSELVHVNPKLAGMGTTVTALLLSGDRLAYAHIGDSRAYRLKDGTFEQMSVDHTFVQRMIDEGRMTEAEAEVHPHKNVLMRVLGDVDASPELDLKYFDASVGERWLLCSDGLNFVRHAMIEQVVRNTKSLAAAADTLIELTLAAGSPDNVTVVLFDVVEAVPDDTSTASLATVAAKSDLAPLSEFDAGLDPDDAELADAAGEVSQDATEPETVDLAVHIRAAAVNRELALREHELVGAAVTANAEGKIPQLADHPAKQRAAAMLTHKPADSVTVVEETEESIPRARRRPLLVAILAGIVALLVVAGAWGAYAWTQTQFFVGVSNGHVAIFNGVSQPLGPISLSHLYRETAVKVESLPEYSRQLIVATLPAASLSDAEQIISDLQLGTGSGTPPCEPKATPSAQTPSPGAETSAPASADAQATPTQSAPAPATSAQPTPTPTCIPGGGQ